MLEFQRSHPKDAPGIATRECRCNTGCQEAITNWVAGHRACSVAAAFICFCRHVDVHFCLSTHAHSFQVLRVLPIHSTACVHAVMSSSISSNTASRRMPAATCITQTWQQGTVSVLDERQECPDMCLKLRCVGNTQTRTLHSWLKQIDRFL